MQHYFGTDGIRGHAGEKLAPELALRAAFGFATRLPKGAGRYDAAKRPQVIVGSDTRLSSNMLMAAVVSGLNLGGCDAIVLGVVPTPAISMLALQGGYIGGVMITASHNPVPDNGIKFFSSDGTKISTRIEQAIEKVISQPGWLRVGDQVHFGQVGFYDPTAEYLAFLKRAVRSTKKRPFSVVLDCACGATGAFAPAAFEQAGFTIDVINDASDGSKINVKCGATDLKGLARRVKKTKAHIGLAFDGDGDRVLAVDEAGRPVSGDKIIALFAVKLKRYREQGAVVMTQMTNIGVEQALNERGIQLHRTEVGDIQVLKGMVADGLSLGGEQSGHIIMHDRLPTGDGILAGLQLAHLVRVSGKPLSGLVAGFSEFPQVLTNLSIKDKQAWGADKRLKQQLKTIVKANPDVRFYLRASGTEDVVRVLTEAKDKAACKRCNAEMCELLLKWDKAR